MDIQSRPAEYGVGRHHAHAEIEARCLTPLLTDAKNGGITEPRMQSSSLEVLTRQAMSAPGDNGTIKRTVDASGDLDVKPQVDQQLIGVKLVE